MVFIIWWIDVFIRIHTYRTVDFSGVCLEPSFSNAFVHDTLWNCSFNVNAHSNSRHKLTSVKVRYFLYSFVMFFFFISKQQQARPSTFINPDQQWISCNICILWCKPFDNVKDSIDCIWFRLFTSFQLINSSHRCECFDTHQFGTQMQCTW